MTAEPKTLIDGLVFPEGPRWHDGRLYFSDMHDHRVVAVDESGASETIVEVPRCPSGLGWLPDGRMLVVSMEDRRLLRLERDGRLTEVADLSALASFHCNDMVVDREGRAYVGNFGFDLHGGAALEKTNLILVEPNGRARVVAEDLGFPNGTVITPDGRTLIVGESFGGCLTAFDVAGDGSLSNRRVWAKLGGGSVPDGICLDAEGAIWVASPTNNRCIRVREGGEVADEIPLPDRNAYACMLGGADRRTLFLCTAKGAHPTDWIALRSGRIETVRASAAGAGLP
ncbi:MAG TPA: SMP-30/gluconolactonase/LRE family protein [Candidatus Binatia bacterium]|nr:SMP-30/gluconolactonase/LRE family protein [Candidatus Binatia bacterium]